MRCIVAVVLIASGLLMACSDSATGPDPQLPEPLTRQERLDAVLTSFRSDNPYVLGIIAYVDQEGHDPWVGASGYQDLSRSVEIGTGDRFKIGSTTKMFTATMVLQLVEEGRVELDHPIIEYLAPEWAATLQQVEYGSEITVAQALSHRSGIMDYTSSPELQANLLADPGALYPPLEIFRLILNGSPNFPPGEEFSYSNTNFHLLGNLLESLTGKPYGEILHGRILSEMGMTRTVLSDEIFPGNLDGVAHAYATLGDRLYDNLEFSGSGWAWAAGGIVSTATELGRFQRALLAGDFFEDPATLESMTTLRKNEWYGMGMMVDEPSALMGRCYGHSGYAFGARAHSRHCPDRNTTVTVFFSVDGTTQTGNLDTLERLYRAASDPEDG